MEKHALDGKEGILDSEMEALAGTFIWEYNAENAKKCSLYAGLAKLAIQMAIQAISAALPAKAPAPKLARRHALMLDNGPDVNPPSRPPTPVDVPTPVDDPGKPTATKGTTGKAVPWKLGVDMAGVLSIFVSFPILIQARAEKVIGRVPAPRRSYLQEVSTTGSWTQGQYERIRVRRPCGCHSRSATADRERNGRL